MIKTSGANPIIVCSPQPVGMRSNLSSPLTVGPIKSPESCLKTSIRKMKQDVIKYLSNNNGRISWYKNDNCV